MKTNPENIPNHVYNWIRECSYEQLDALRQKEVLRYLDATDYNELHRTTLVLAGMKRNSPARGKESRKKELLQHFDERHQVQKGAVFFLSRPVPMWKAAAVVVILLAGWVFFYLNEKPGTKPEMMASVDTVYVTKEIPVEPLKIYDTVYVTKYRESGAKKERVQPVKEIPNGSMNTGNAERIHVLPVKALENQPQRPRGNSMKDDTLLKKFSFVTM